MAHPAQPDRQTGQRPPLQAHVRSSLWPPPSAREPDPRPFAASASAWSSWHHPRRPTLLLPVRAGISVHRQWCERYMPSLWPRDRPWSPRYACPDGQVLQGRPFRILHVLLIWEGAVLGTYDLTMTAAVL